MPNRLMIGVVDLDSQLGIPFYQTFTVGDKCDVRSLAKALALYQLQYRRFVFMTFPADTSWSDADKAITPLWAKYAY